MNPNEWEALCQKCGECCFEKWQRLDGTYLTTRVPCRHLDIISRECRVYAKRLQVGVGCVRLTPGLAKNAAWLPEDCAYVHKFRRTK